MTTSELIVRGRRVVLPQGLRPGAIHIKYGRIDRIGEFNDIQEGASIVEAGDLVVMPGLVDSHVHINEPGRTEWEGFVSATQAAAAGGITTLVDMPLNSVPPTTTQKGLLEKAEAMEGRIWVDIGLWGGAVSGNQGELRTLIKEGALGFKCFLVESGVPEFSHLNASELEKAVRALSGTGAPLLAHAELPGPIEAAQAELSNLDPKSYARYLRSRPKSAEDQAIELLHGLCNTIGTSIHIVHLSSSTALDTFRRARDKMLPFSAETTPHYLCFEAESIPDGQTQYKCAPPIRERENKEALWKALREGLIEMVVSDHSPCPPEMKKLGEGRFDLAWGGISSVELALPATWTEARQRNISIHTLSEWMCSSPARLAGLEKRKGKIAVGYDADLTLWNPDASFRVDAQKLHHRHRITPYQGRELFGTVEMTFLRGTLVYDRNGIQSKPNGIWIKRTAH